MSEFNALSDLLYGPGEPMRGSDLSNEDAMTYARATFPEGRYCLVRNWRWTELDVSDQQRAELARTGRQPVILYADCVVFDSERRWDTGDFVRTSLLRRLNEGFHFTTLNTTYLLLGPGQRKRTSAETVASIF